MAGTRVAWYAIDQADRQAGQVDLLECSAGGRGRLDPAAKQVF